MSILVNELTSIIPLCPQNETKTAFDRICDVSVLTYNMIRDKVYTDYQESQTINPDHQEWFEYVRKMVECQLWHYVNNRDDAYIMHGSIMEFEDDLSMFLDKRTLTFPMPKRFDSSEKSFRIYITEPFKANNCLTPIQILIPGIGNLTFANQISSNLLEDIRKVSNKIIYVECVKRGELYGIRFYLEKWISSDIILVPGQIGIYLDSDPYTITLSNGDKFTMPYQYMTKISKLQDIQKQDPEYYKDRKAEREVRMLLQEIQACRENWFFYVAYELINNYDIIYAEHQPRETPEYENISLHPYPMYIQGWIHFLSIINDAIRKTGSNCKLIRIWKSSTTLTLCSHCGTYINQNPGLSWTCPNCNTYYKDSKLNAAQNVLRKGLLKTDK